MKLIKKILSSKLLMILAALVILAVYYYIALPPINIHSDGLWKFILVILIAALAFVSIPHLQRTSDPRKPLRVNRIIKNDKIFKLF